MFLQTDKISFRPIEREDLAMLRDWRNDPEIRLRTREKFPLNLLDQEKWWESLRDRKNIMFLIRAYGEGIHDPYYPIGVCGLTHIDWLNRSGELSWYIGDKNYRGKKLGRHIIFLLNNYGFLELGLHRIWGECYNNTDLPDMYRKLGFFIEAKIRDTYWYNGQWYGSTFFSMIECEWNLMRETYLDGH